MIADAYLKGFRGFDAEAAWAEVVKSLENPRPNSRVDLVEKYGYFPFDQVKVESVSMLLEDAINCDAVNTVGAGDSMVAGFLAGYMRTKDYSYALKLGIAAGAATAAAPGLASGEEIERMMEV